MGAEKHYIIVNPSGDICLVYRATGKLSDNPFPISMRDEYGRVLPHAEQGPYGYGCVPVNLNDPGEGFSRIMISEEQFALIGHQAFFCYFYDRRGRHISLRPGHRRMTVDAGHWRTDGKEHVRTEVAYPDDLELCGIAYGGRPIYWIKWHSEKSHTDFPELTAQGCLHPLKYKPRQAPHTTTILQTQTTVPFAHQLFTVRA